jgi:hypothetical protein
MQGWIKETLLLGRICTLFRKDKGRYSGNFDFFNSLSIINYMAGSALQVLHQSLAHSLSEKHRLNIKV